MMCYTRSEVSDLHLLCYAMLKQIKGYFSKYLTLNYERIILIEFSMVENGLSNHVLFFPLR